MSTIENEPKAQDLNEPKAKSSNQPTIYPVGIIGGGPAGWTAALYLARADLRPLLFEGELDGGPGLPGGQLMTTTEVENYPGFPNGGISGWDMMDRFKAQGVEFGTQIVEETVTSITCDDSNLFTVATKRGEYTFKAVIISTGATAKYLGLPSEEKFLNRGVSACATCDGALPRFRGNPIVVVGGGDTAMEEALFLARFASRVHVIHRRDTLRASPIMAKRLLEHPKITMEWNTVVDEVLGDDSAGVTGTRVKNLITGETRTLECSGFFVAIGHKPNSDLFLDYVNVDESGYIITKGKSSETEVPGMFACGDVQDKIYRQAITAAGSGCMAAIDCTRWLESQEK